MGVEAERDDMMERMTLTQRSARDCPGKHSLPTELGRNGREVMLCAKCNWHSFRGRGCELCYFALCPRCIETDLGLMVVDPYEEVVRIAQAIVKKKAQASCRATMVSTTFRWESEWGEIRPGTWITSQWINPDSQVLHGGVRLVVRMSEKLRSVLLGDESATSEVTCPGEVDEILSSNGATLKELQNLQGAVKRSDNWSKVTQVLKERAQTVYPSIHDNINNSTAAYTTTMKLVSLDVYTVIFEVGARVDGRWIASLHSFRGECGFNFGMRADAIQRRLEAVGASL
jgi:hypothetical protein